MEVVFDPYEALEGAHAAVVLTEWEEVRTLDPKEASPLMEPPRVWVDGRNVMDAAAALEAGLTYRGFGRG
jgi:UDPglucose 6-dehydrogenase